MAKNALFNSLDPLRESRETIKRYEALIAALHMKLTSSGKELPPKLSPPQIDRMIEQVKAQKRRIHQLVNALIVNGITVPPDAKQLTDTKPVAMAAEDKE